MCFIYHNTTLVQQPIDHTNLTNVLVADVEAFIDTAAEQEKSVRHQQPLIHNREYALEDTDGVMISPVQRVV